MDFEVAKLIDQKKRGLKGHSTTADQKERSSGEEENFDAVVLTGV